MRILAIVADMVPYYPNAYESIVKAKPLDFVAIVVVPCLPRNKPVLFLFRFLFQLYGIHGFILKIFEVAQFRLLNLTSRFINIKKCYSLQGIARKYHIPLYYVRNINSEDFLQLVENLHPDIILSSQGQIVGKHLLSIPKYGVLNKHAGMLPQYRGVFPVFWAMYNKEKEIGITVYRMNEKLDCGNILYQEKIPITPNDTFDSLYKKINFITPRLLLSTIDFIETGNAKQYTNDDTKATYFGFPTIEDIRRFKMMGLKII